MTNAEFFLERWEMEQGAFRKVLAALPPDKLDYRPHERSASAGGLAWQLAKEQGDLIDLLEKGECTFSPAEKRPETLAAITEAWDEATSSLREKLKARDESKWPSPAKFKVDDAVVWEDTLQNILWGFLFDMVHHRGQLSSYIRPMGGKVPAIYGPSADAES